MSSQASGSSGPHGAQPCPSGPGFAYQPNSRHSLDPGHSPVQTARSSGGGGHGSPGPDASQPQARHIRSWPPQRGQRSTSQPGWWCWPGRAPQSRQSARRSADADTVDMIRPFQRPSDGDRTRCDPPTIFLARRRPGARGAGGIMGKRATGVVRGALCRVAPMGWLYGLENFGCVPVQQGKSTSRNGFRHNCQGVAPLPRCAGGPIARCGSRDGVEDVRGVSGAAERLVGPAKAVRCGCVGRWSCNPPQPRRTVEREAAVGEGVAARAASFDDQAGLGFTETSAERVRECFAPSVLL